ncbi:hypothetical protein EJ06DRAFT_507035 [Trichodelitschia bisporula]|uniref:COP9 signalosome complex subunit 3 N-terminal helical repeats domain-containing protein n=1 Tax=Trichodelitschia bisporula TaxID=703511 RepID=A0A6G1I2U7_9PEZI|nr:hypothetical protein EJ06DRAFT_507035 [Trichodelitschia bisporula]
MADLASLLLEFPPQDVEQLTPEEYEARITAFVASLREYGPQRAAAVDAEQDLLKILDPSINSIAYLFVLSCRASRRTLKARLFDSTFWDRAAEFLRTFDPVQVRYAGTDLRNLLEVVASLAMQSQSPAAAVLPLRDAIFRLDPSSGTFTSNHVLFLQLCISSRCFNESLPILESVIHSFPTATPLQIDGPYPCSDHHDSSGYITLQSGLTAPITVSDVQDYYSMGALIYIGLHQWYEAAMFLEHVLATPSQGAVSGLMVEAYQRWVLISCIYYGEAKELSTKLYQPNLIRTLKACSKAYDHLAEVVQSRNASRLQAEILAGLQKWHEDGNLGLVQELKTSLPLFAVINLRCTYAALPITAVATLLNLTPDAATEFVEDVIEAGHINAVLEFPDAASSGPVLRFFHDTCGGPLVTTEDQLVAQLTQQTSRTVQIAKHVRAANHRIMLRNDYIDSQRRRAKQKQEEVPTAEVEMGWDPTAVPDEDIMVDS